MNLPMYQADKLENIDWLLDIRDKYGIYFTIPNKKVELYETYFEEYMNTWKRFREICEEIIAGNGVKICIENTNGYRDYEKRAMEYLLESDVFGLTWDIGHSNSAGNVDESFIMDHKDKLFHFHINDS